MTKAQNGLFLTVLALAVSVQAAHADDAFTRWQDQEARNRLLDEEKHLLDKELTLQHDLVEIDREIIEKSRKRVFINEDLRNLRRDIISLKMRLM